MGQTPDTNELLFEPLRMPMVDFLPSVRTPYREWIVPSIFLGDSLTVFVRPDAQALESYELRLPEPTWLEVQTTPIVGAPNGLFAGLDAAAAPLSDAPWAFVSMSLDAERTMGTGRLAIFGRNPFRVALDGYYSAIFAGGPREVDATIYFPDPGNTISVEIEVGAVYCRILDGPNLEPEFLPLRLRDGSSGYDVAVGELYWDPNTEVSEARMLAPPGTFELDLEVGDLEIAPAQRFPRPIEVRAGEVQTIEWTLSTGATLHGRLGTPWQTANDRLYIRSADGGSWRVIPELGPDGREFALHHVPDGYLILFHERENHRVYYPGSRDESTAEVIHVSGAQDIYDLIFLR
jgi:hypothetical protein